MIPPESFFANVTNAARFREAIRRFDLANASDPTTEVEEGRPWPKELLYAERLTQWVMKLNPEVSEELRLAARSQHICRWKIPRNSYPQTREGYLRWRSDLKAFHARTAGEILDQVGYPLDVIDRVQALNLKKEFPRDPESRVLEDALCLVFLEHQFVELAQRKTDEKVVNAVRKTWKKMSPAAHAEATRLSFPARETELVRRALGPG